MTFRSAGLVPPIVRLVVPVSDLDSYTVRGPRFASWIRSDKVPGNRHIRARNLDANVRPGRRSPVVNREPPHGRPGARKHKPLFLTSRLARAAQLDQDHRVISLIDRIRIGLRPGCVVPSIVTPAVTAGRSVEGAIVCTPVPGMSNVTTLPSPAVLASRIACRSEPAPLSFVLVTGKSDSNIAPPCTAVRVCASGRPSHSFSQIENWLRTCRTSLAVLVCDIVEVGSVAGADQVRRVLPGRWGAHLAVRTPPAAFARESFKKKRSTSAHVHDGFVVGSSSIVGCFRSSMIRSISVASWRKSQIRWSTMWLGLARHHWSISLLACS